MIKTISTYLNKKKQEKFLANNSYNHIILAARNPILYINNKIPDTINSRFELIILHLFILFYRLQNNNKTIKSIKQKIFNYFLEDMDNNLHEIGVGPDSIQKYIQKILENFYGRTIAYTDAINKKNINILIQIIFRNLYLNNKQNKLSAKLIAKYILYTTKKLKKISTKKIISSKFNFIE